MKIIILWSIIFSFPFIVSSQNGEVGEWIDYSPYHSIFDISEGNGKIYAASNYGLIEFTKGDNSFLRFSKVEGLSDVGITCVAFNEFAETFVVGYSNGKIDLITPYEIVTLTDLNRKTISGNKSLNSIYMLGKYAYISTGFGIVKFDVDRQEFSETYFIDEDGDYLFVNDLTISNDTIYAATVNGVRKAWVNDPQITFYESWSMDLNLDKPNKEYDLITSFENDIYLNLAGSNGNEDSLFLNTGNGTWNYIEDLSVNIIESIEAYDNYTLISHSGHVSCYDSNWVEFNRVYNYGEGNYVSANNAILGKDSVIWIGDNRVGLVKNERPFTYEVIDPESPKNGNVDDINIRNNNIWIAAGGHEKNWNPVYSNDGVYWRNPDLEWGNINKFKDTTLNGVFDLVTIITSPFNANLTYAGSLGGGLVEFDGYKTTQVFNNKNSPLKESIDANDWVAIPGLDFDKQGNLWMTNSKNPNCIAVYTKDKDWFSYNFGSLITDDITSNITVASSNYKWATLPGEGILIFDDGGTLDDLTDDQSKILNGNAGYGGLPSKDVYCLAEDHDGEIWVGTGEGVAVFYSPGNVFTEGVNFDAQQIIVEVDGYFQYLLGTETVTAIAIDGANRKWFGTNGSGVFLMSADGTKELYHFTTDNSPLMSNFIRVIEINESTGEVLFGTDNGIIAFKNSATGDEITTASTYAYPNPVPQNYYGLIAVKGLAANSSVRITDIAGNLVFETIAEGTQVVWDGNDMNGQRVGTGVYLVFGIDVNGQDSQVAKILFTK
jgi:hypothetical protein